MIIMTSAFPVNLLSHHRHTKNCIWDCMNSVFYCENNSSHLFRTPTDPGASHCTSMGR